MAFVSDKEMVLYKSNPINSLNCGRNWGAYKAYETYQAPAPLRRSLTTIPWSPTVYYGNAKTNSCLASLGKLPEPLAYSNDVHRLDSVKVPAVFSAARNNLYTRYTPEDWLRNKRTIPADQVRATAERLRTESFRLANELDERSKNTKLDVDKKLGDRISDINFWKDELTQEADEMVNECNLLNKAKSALEAFLKDSENQSHINKECLFNREKRQGIDLLHDEAEKSLLGEADLIRRVQDLTRAYIKRAVDQLNLNRSALHELEMDTRDKHVANVIDSGAFNLKETSRGVQLHRGMERVDNSVTVPESWAEFTNNNLNRSQSERHASRCLRNDIQSMLNDASDQLWRQWNKVNTELNRRVCETLDAKNVIQSNLAGTLQEIFDTEKSIELIKKAINDKINNLKVATTRLENRLHRPNMEACRDQPQNRLVQEVYELEEAIESLNNQLRCLENQLEQLLRKRSSLEHNLAIKNNSLFIDKEKCLGMRKTYPMQEKVYQLI